MYKWRTEIAKAEITIALLFIYYIFVEIMNLNCLVDGMKLSSCSPPSSRPRHFSACDCEREHKSERCIAF